MKLVLMTSDIYMWHLHWTHEDPGQNHKAKSNRDKQNISKHWKPIGHQNVSHSKTASWLCDYLKRLGIRLKHQKFSRKHGLHWYYAHLKEENTLDLETSPNSSWLTPVGHSDDHKYLDHKCRDDPRPQDRWGKPTPEGIQLPSCQWKIGYTNCHNSIESF